MNEIKGIIQEFDNEGKVIIKTENNNKVTLKVNDKVMREAKEIVLKKLEEYKGSPIIAILDINKNIIKIKENEEEIKKVIDIENKPKNSFKGVKIETKKESKDFETVNIKGKEYVMVNERIKYFRKNYPTYSIVSEIVELNEKQATFKSSILNESGQVLATGHAQEKADSSFINKTSYIENAETSSWGRALANMGIGIDVSMASADEVANAINNQK